jgi:drug/metabolite transporter (DMT)-like permease
LIFIILQIVFGSIFTLVVKWAQNRGKDDVVTIGCINYIVAAVAALPVWWSNPETGATTDQVWGAIGTGGTMGAVYFVAFFFAIAAIRWLGAAAATAISTLSILLPIGFASWYWASQPSAKQMFGVLLAIFALFLIGAKKADAKSASGVSQKEEQIRPALKLSRLTMSIVMLVFFLLCGMSRIMQEAFNKVSLSAENPTFLLSCFVIAGVPSVIYLAWQFLVQRKKFLWSECAFGGLMGVSNILQAHFVLRSLDYYAGFFVFPVTSAGAVIFTTIVAMSCLGERLTAKSLLGISISVVALFLLND